MQDSSEGDSRESGTGWTESQRLGAFDGLTVTREVNLSTSELAVQKSKSDCEYEED